MLYCYDIKVIESVPTLGDGLKTLLEMAERVVPDYDPEASVSLTKFMDQLPSVFSQVRLA